MTCALLISRDHPDLGDGLLIVTSNQLRKGCSLLGPSRLGSRRDVGLPAAHLCFQTPAHTDPKLLRSVGAQLLFGLKATLLAETAVTAIERTCCPNYPPFVKTSLYFPVLSSSSVSLEAPAGVTGSRHGDVMNPCKTLHLLLQLVWGAPAVTHPSSFSFVHLHTSAGVFRITLQWE